MNGKELFFLAAFLGSLYFIYASFKTIQQYSERVGLEQSQKNFFYAITLVAPLLGFILTRRLRNDIV